MSSTDWYSEYAAEAHDLIAGTMGGCSGVFIGQPYDLVKVRLQCGLGVNGSALATARNIAKTEGLLAFWKGILPPITANVPINAIGFASYGNCNRFMSTLLEKYNPTPANQTYSFDGIEYIVPTTLPSLNEHQSLLDALDEFHHRTPQQRQTEKHQLSQEQLLSKFQHLYPSLNPQHLQHIRTLEDLKAASLYNAANNSHNTNLNWHTAIFIAGCWSGLLSCMISTPSELLKIQEQNYQGQMKMSSVTLARKIAQEHGFRSLYRGFWATVWRDCPSVGVYFWVYEFCKWGLRKETCVPTIIYPISPSQPLHPTNNPQIGASQSSFQQPKIQWTQKIDYDFTAPLIAGGLAGPASWLSTYHFDVIKSRLQTLTHEEYQKTSMLKVYREIVSKHGYKFFFTGLSTTLVRSVPVNAVTFLLYEKTLKLCQNHRFLMPKQD